MQQIKRLVVFLLIMIGTGLTASANHIMGGDMYYGYLGKKAGNPNIDRYIVTAIYYRDCAAGAGGAQLANSYEFGVYNALTGNLYASLVLPRRAINPLVEYAPKCRYPSSYCIEEGVYSDTLEIASNIVNNPGFHVSSYTWRRNSGINNISTTGTGPFAGGNDGMVWYCYIPPSGYANSSSRFLAKPVPYMCVNNDFVFNHLGYDPDGDSLAFSIVWPYGMVGAGANTAAGQAQVVGQGIGAGVPNSPIPSGVTPNPPLPGAIPTLTQWYPTVFYNFPPYFFPGNQMPTSTGININSVTGELYFRPTQTGNFVMAVEVKEYRVDRVNNTTTYLGSIRRDLQILVNNLNCATNSAPIINVASDSFNVVPGTNLTFVIQAFDPDGDSTWIIKNGTIFDNTSGGQAPFATMPSDSGRTIAQTTFSWTPDCKWARVAPYFFTIQTYDNFCNTRQKTIFIKVQPPDIMLPPDLRCIKVKTASTIEVNWNAKFNNPQDFYRYYVYRRTGTTGSFTLIDSVSNINSTIYNDLKAFNATTQLYQYYVTAKNYCFEEGLASNTMQNMILTATKTNTNTLQLSWTEPTITASTGITYRIFKDIGTGFGLIGTTTNKFYTATSCNDSASYRVQINDGIGNCISWAYSPYFKLIDTSRLTATVLSSASVITNTSIQVGFAGLSSTKTKYYKIYRSVNNGSYTSVGQATHLGNFAHSYIDTGIVPTLNKYAYQVSGVDSCGFEGPLSNQHQAIRVLGTPSQVSNILRWSKYQGTSVLNQKVEKLITGVWTSAATLSASDSVYTDFAITSCSLPVEYRISANLTGNIPVLSNTVTVTPFDTIKPNAATMYNASVTGTTQVTVSYLPSNSVDVSVHEIYTRINNGAAILVATHKAIGSGAQSLVISGVDVTNKKNCFYVVAVDSCSGLKSDISLSHCVVKTTTSPLNLSARINWSSYVGYPIANYTVQKLQGVSWIDRAIVTDTFYVDTPLACNQMVTYRIVSNEISPGNGRTNVSNQKTVTPFDTLPPATQPLIVSSVVSTGSVKVDWAAAGGKVGTYELWYKSPNSAWIFAGTTNLLSLTINGLKTRDSVYCYRLVSIDTCALNKSIPSAIHCTVLLKGIAQNLQNTLNWTSYSGFVPDRYVIDKKIGSSYVAIDSVLGSILSYTHLNLPCNVLVNYRIRTISATGLVSLSDSLTVTPFDTLPPATQPLIVSSVVSTGSVKVDWAAAGGKVGTYELWYKSPNSAWIFAGTTNLLTLTINGLKTHDSVYCYRLVSIDTCALNKSIPSAIHCTVLLKGIAQNLQNTLNWTSYSGFVPDRYVIDKKIGSSYVAIDSVLGSILSYTHLNLPCNVPVNYRIRTISATGLVSLSDSLTLTPFDTLPPVQPFVNTVSVLNSGFITISWPSSLSGDVNRYDIYKAQPGFPLAYYKSVGNINTFTDTVSTKSIWYYAVMAIDSCQNNKSILSLIHNSMVPTAKRIGCEKKVKLDWNKYTNFSGGTATYQIERSTNGSVFATIGSVLGTDSTYNDLTIVAMNTYCYRIKATSGTGGFVAYSDSICIYILPPPPGTIVRVTKESTSPTNGTVRIDWLPHTTLPQASFQRLYYSSNANGPFTVIQNSIPASQTSFLHTGRNTATADHWYFLTMIDSCGNESDSSTNHKTIDFSVTGGQLIQNLKWTPYKGWLVAKYNIYKINAGIQTLFTSVPGTDTFYRYYPAPCFVEITYIIKAFNAAGDSSVSDTASFQAVDAFLPDAALITNATVVNNQNVLLSFTAADSLDMFAYAIERSINGGGFGVVNYVAHISSGLNMQYVDTVNALINKLCYRITALDSCLNAALSNTFCTMQLEGTAQNLQNTLRWNKFVGYPIGNYQVDSLSGSTWITIANTTDTNFVHTNLACNVTQSYRVKAFEFGGSRFSFSDTLRLTPFDTVAPFAPSINVASVTSATTINVQWTLSTSGDVRNYEMWIKSNNSAWTKRTSVGNITAYTFTGLSTPDSSYCIRIIAVDTCAQNKSLPSVEHCVVQLKGLAGNLQNTLNWNAYSGFTTDRYIIDRKVGNAYVALDSVSGNILSYTQTNLPCKIPVNYRIRTISSTGLVSLSDTLTLVPYDTIPPTAQPLVLSSVVTSGAVKVDWNAAGGDVGTYELWYKSPNSAWILTTTTNLLTHTIFGLKTQDSVYCYRLVAIDTCAFNKSLPGPLHCTILLKGTPENLQNTLNWSAYVGFSINKYIIEKKVGTAYVAIDSVNASTLSYSHTNLPCKVPVNYRIKAISITGLVSLSDSLTLTPFDTIPPVPQPLVISSVVTSGSVKVDWTAAGGDVGTYELWYKSPNSAWKLGGTTNLLTFTIPTLKTRDSVYCFRLVAVDTCALNKSIPSAQHCAVLLKGTAGNLQNNLSWTSYIGTPITRYVIERKVGAAFISIDSVSNSTLNYTHTNVFCKVPETYRIKTIANSGSISYSDTLSLTAFDTLPPPPPTIYVASVISSGSIKVDWLSSGGKVGFYELWYKTRFGNWTFKTNTNLLTHTLSGLNTNDSVYCFRLIALDTCSNAKSAPSAVHCTSQLNGIAANLLNILHWNRYFGFNGIIGQYLENSRGGGPWALDSVIFQDSIYAHDPLWCNVEYIYRLKTVSFATGAISYSDTLKLIPFDTIKPLPAELKVASVKSNNTIYLSWNPTPSQDANLYEIWRREEGGVYIPIKAFRNQFFYTDTVPNSTLTTRYSYYLIVTDTCNTNNRSVPSNEHATMNANSTSGSCIPTVLLSWNKYPYLQSLSGYRILRSVDGSPFGLYQTLPTSDTSYIDFSVTVGSSYCYKIEAYNALGDTSLSDSTCISPYFLPLPGSSNIDLTTVIQSGVANGVVTVSWKQRVATDILAKAYNIYHSTVSQNGPFTLVSSQNNLNVTSYTHNGINTSSGRNYYQVKLLDSCNNETLFPTVSSPVNVSLANLNLQINLNWTRYVGDTVTRYVIEKQQGIGSYFRMDSTVSDTFFSDALLSCGEKYTYRILSYLKSGLISVSDLESAIAYDTIPPDPSNFTVATVNATSSTGGVIELRYQSAPQANRKGYRIYRSVNNGAFSAIATVLDASSGSMVYIDQPVNTRSNTYRYYITSLDSCGNESDSLVSHQPVNSTVTAKNGFNDISWMPYKGFANFNYSLERRTPTSNWVSIATYLPNQLAHSDSAVKCDTIYYYRIITKDLMPLSNVFSLSDTSGVMAFKNTPPAAPVVVNATVVNTSVSSGQIRLNWNPSTSLDTYKQIINRSSDGITYYPIVTLYNNANTFLNFGLNTVDSIYSYYIDVIDSCRNINLSPSSTHTVIHLVGTAGNESANLNWTPYVGWPVGSYEIWRDSILVGSVNGSTFQFIDQNILCINVYTYKIVAIKAGDTVSSVSNTSKVRPYDTNKPQGIDLLSVSVEPGNKPIKVKWTTSSSFDVKNYLVVRTRAGNPNRLIVYRGLGVEFIDSLSLNPSQFDYCYTVLAEDYCGNYSDSSKRHCTMVLKGEAGMLYNKLTWTPYIGIPVDKYEVYRQLDNESPEKIATLGGSQTQFTDSNLPEDITDFCYHIKASMVASVETSLSNSICIRQDAQVFMPNAFSPQYSLGLNDYFGPIGTYYESYAMRIFNRWGELVFESSAKDPLWNGKDKSGNFVQIGNYVFTLSIVDLHGKTIFKKGVFSIIN